jgi:hypothetical protein
MKVVVLVPRRADGGHRDRLWAFARARWLADHPDWPIFEGHHEDGPFSRSAAINAAALDAGDFDVAVILDSDVVVDPDAVVDAVVKAGATGRLIITHRERVDLSRRGTERVLAGYAGPWRRKPIFERVWPESDSSCVAVPRSLWDEVGGFDERFVGWGYEDTAFVIACERAAGPAVKLDGEVFHLWHPRAADGARDSPTRAANLALLEQIRAATPADGLIPRIFHRTVPEQVDPQLEAWWEARMALHPGWDFRTYRDPIEPGLFPATSPLWERCETGAQKADLIRLEALVQWGGVYVDADCRPVSSHEPLRCARAFAAWEDETTIPNAVMGAVPNHPAMVEALERSIDGVKRGRKTYDSGVAVTTAVFRGRDDMVLLPPGAFYPHHYLEKHQAGRQTGPWTIEEHMWAHSWGDERSKRSIAERQRT